MYMLQCLFLKLISGLLLSSSKYFWHYFQNAAKHSYVQLAAVEQQKTREKVKKLAVDHKVWEYFLLSKVGSLTICDWVLPCF